MDHVRVVVDAVERFAGVEVPAFERPQELLHQHMADAPPAVVERPAPTAVVVVPTVLAMGVAEARLEEPVHQLAVPAEQVLAVQVVIEPSARGGVER